MLLGLDLLLVALELAAVVAQLAIQAAELVFAFLSFSLDVDVQYLILFVKPSDLSLVLVKLISEIELLSLEMRRLLLEAIELRGIVDHLLLHQLQIAL